MLDREKPPGVSYYEWWTDHDIIGWLQPMWEEGGWKLRADGKLVCDHHTIAMDSPWIHAKVDWRLNCVVWQRMIFYYVAHKFSPKFVPSRCHECWKTVVRPRTLTELFALEELHQKMGVPAKCGIEKRHYVHGLYGGYFYGVGFMEGCQRYLEVRKAVNDDPRLGPDIPIILKRACTEFENACGPSNEWRLHPKQYKIEEMFERYVVHDDWERDQPEIVKAHIRKQWIEFAFANGDQTYLEYTNGKPLSPAPVTYEKYAESPDFPNNIMKPTTPSPPVDGGGANASEEQLE